MYVIVVKTTAAQFSVGVSAVLRSRTDRLSELKAIENHFPEPSKQVSLVTSKKALFTQQIVYTTT